MRKVFVIGLFKRRMIFRHSFSHRLTKHFNHGQSYAEKLSLRPLPEHQLQRMIA
jgi:hypothetical protein